jgi:thiamine-phosphate pyrophosphorylase
MTATRTSRAPSVILITDPRWPLARIEEVIENVGRALEAGAFAVQLRDKAASASALARAASTLRTATRRVSARLIINAANTERLRVAADADADGAHVPCRAENIIEARVFGCAWISTPAHTDEDVATAQMSGADAVLVSPIFESPGKGTPRGVQALSAARALAGDLAVYALGGVAVPRVAACAAAGADGVAVIRALLDAEDPATTARAFDALFQSRESGIS